MSKKYPLILAHVCLYKGDVLVSCDAEGKEQWRVYRQEYIVSHWDDTWLYYRRGNGGRGGLPHDGEIDWLYYRIIEEGKKPINSDPAMFEQQTERKDNDKFPKGIHGSQRLR